MTDSTNNTPAGDLRFQAARPELQLTLPTMDSCGLDLTFDEWLAVALCTHGYVDATWEDEGVGQHKAVWIKCPVAVPVKVSDSVRYATRGWFPRAAFKVSVRKPAPVEQVDQNGNVILVTVHDTKDLWVQPQRNHLAADLADILPPGTDTDRVVASMDSSTPSKRQTPWKKSPLTSWIKATRCMPGVWMKYPEPVKTHVPWHIKNGDAYSAIPGEFAVAMRDDKSNNPTTCDMYVMYMGPVQPAETQEVSDRIDDLLFFNPPWITDKDMRRAKYNNYNCQPPMATWLDACVRQNPGMTLIYPMPFDMHSNLKARIEEGRGFHARPGEFNVEMTEIRDLYGFKVKTLRAKVSQEWRSMYPDYPVGIPDPFANDAQAEPSPVDNLDAVAKKVRNVTIDDALEPGERLTAEGTPAW